jgi:hypothetical protein
VSGSTVSCCTGKKSISSAVRLWDRSAIFIQIRDRPRCETTLNIQWRGLSFSEQQPRDEGAHRRDEHPTFLDFLNFQLTECRLELIAAGDSPRELRRETHLKLRAGILFIARARWLIRLRLRLRDWRKSQLTCRDLASNKPITLFLS